MAQTLSGTPSVLARRRRRLGQRLVARERGLTGLLVLVALVALGAMLQVEATFDATVLLAPLMLAGLLLTPRGVQRYVAVVLVLLAAETVVEVLRHQADGSRSVSLVLFVLMCAVTVFVSRTRAGLGVTGMRGDAMLMDLQGRLGRQGHLPVLPAPWHAQVATRAAGGTSFAGDFVVAHLDDETQVLSLVLVDVSGKGVHAGTRSLLLSGAFGALLGSVSPAQFLPAANAFLVRQEWEDDFATAVHVALDIRSGTYEVRSAGHPPAIQFQAGAGHWLVHGGLEGPVLGVVARPDFELRCGRLSHGDALLLYTDGLVERTRRDINLGIDRLIGECERLVRGGLRSSAPDLVERLGARDDDCALIVLQHS